MELLICKELQADIRQKFDSNMADYPQKRHEIDVFLAECTPEQAICLEYLYAFMHVNDIVSTGVEDIFSYVSATLEARKKLDYTKDIPTDVFLSYVLSHRVNGEDLDESRPALFLEIYPRVLGKTMYEAVLEVNYWCYEHGTYTPSDDRTISPLAMMRSTLGRCGEESVFTVSALRSVGIPARQCYVPRWSHCDDNHAWVEVWVDGNWHYLGACEPEPVLDKGWFTAAASKAMLMHSKTWSSFANGEDVAYRTPLYSLINSTALYADCAILTVHVTKNSLPVAGVTVQFQLINYSELFTIYRTDTDVTGTVRFKTGLGDLVVCICQDGKLLSRRVDLRATRETTLDLSERRSPSEMAGVQESFDLVPPAEKVREQCSAKQLQRHNARLVECDRLRNARWNSFCHDETDGPFALYRCRARGNLDELDAFLADVRFTNAEKEDILFTLRPKDCIDCTAEMLADTLLAAKPYHCAFSHEVWRDYLLAPRVADEMLALQRSKLLQLFPDGFSNGSDILAWLKNNVKIMPDYGTRNWYADCTGSILQGHTSAHSFGVLFVTLCRTFGIPARRNPNTLEYEWATMENGQPVFHSIEHATEPAQHSVSLTLHNDSGSPLHYDEQFTLARFIDGEYQTQRYTNMVLNETAELTVPAGDYRLITTVRQIDGTLSAHILYFSAEHSCTADLVLPNDETASRIKSIDVMAQLENGALRNLLETTAGKRRIVIFAEPGKEPTEHLLQELLACKDAYNAAGYGIHLLIEPQAKRENPTLCRVLAELNDAVLDILDEPAALAYLHKCMGIGDERLPFTLALDAQNHGLYASANYNINTAQTLLKIQQLSAGKQEEN